MPNPPRATRPRPPYSCLAPVESMASRSTTGKSARRRSNANGSPGEDGSARRSLPGHGDRHARRHLRRDRTLLLPPAPRPAVASGGRASCGARCGRHRGMPDTPLPREPLYIRMHPADNVAIVANEGGLDRGATFECGLTLREKVPQGHKVALADIAAGDAVRRYGVPIGYAAQGI